MPGISGAMRVAERLSSRADVPNDVKELLFAMAEDIQVLKTALAGVTAKLDLDAGVTDTNYSSLWPVSAVHVTP